MRTIKLLTQLNPTSLARQELTFNPENILCVQYNTEMKKLIVIPSGVATSIVPTGGPMGPQPMGNVVEMVFDVTQEVGSQFIHDFDAAISGGIGSANGLLGR
jgi:hypothetical protein